MVFFLIGANVLEAQQGKGNVNGTWNVITEQISKYAAGVQFQAECNTFKLGNLDSLFHNTEVMQKLETQFEALLRKIERQYLDTSEEQFPNFKIDTTETSLPIDQYLTKFKWQNQKFPKSQPLTELLNTIKKRVDKIDESFRKKAHEYQEEKNKFQALQSKEGNLYVRDLADVLRPELVKDQDFTYTNHITTLIAVVPKNKEQEFLQKYELISDNVLPGSAKLFSQVDDKDGLLLYRVCLYTQELNEQVIKQMIQEEELRKKEESGEIPQGNRQRKYFKTPVENYIFKCREELQVVIREFKFNKEFYQNRVIQRSKIQTQSEQEKKLLTELCKNSFSELYIIYIHLKHLRLVVDIATRFGQQEQVCTALIHPNPGKDKNTILELTKMFCEPSQMGMYGTKEELEDTEDFFPYAYVPISI